MKPNAVCMRQWRSENSAACIQTLRPRLSSPPARADNPSRRNQPFRRNFTPCFTERSTGAMALLPVVFVIVGAFLWGDGGVLSALVYLQWRSGRGGCPPRGTMFSFCWIGNYWLLIFFGGGQPFFFKFGPERGKQTQGSTRVRNVLATPLFTFWRDYFILSWIIVFFPSIHQSVCLYFWLSVCLSICQNILSIHP